MRKLIVKSVRKEILFQLGRLKHHPSVFVWSANNENELGINEWFHGKANRSKYHSDYLTLYKDLLGDTVSKVDFKSRPFLLSSPTNGVETFQVGGISENPNSEFYGDMHYYTFSDMWPPFEPPVARCISEFGFQSLPFVETLKSAGFEQKDFNFNSQSLLHRQHHSLAHASMASRSQVTVIFGVGYS
uniref:Glycoside hydrolase family 2 catalytic domain-containing protein n=1 Tax=Trichuris muris TaxID=70415 RepID=A0A5S6PZS2_TRIMR